MKKNVFIFVSLFVLSLTAIAQEKVNLVIFSEDGDAFFVNVNGIRQNDKPETNVKVTGISPNISLRIDFQDKALPSLKQSGPLEPGFEHTMRIKRDAKKQLKLRYFGSTPLGSETNSGATTVAYHSVENPMSENNATIVNTSVNPNSGNTTVTSSTTTTKISQGNADQENVAVNINMAGIGINMNVTGMDGMAGTTMNSTTSTTVTNSSSSNSKYSSSENNQMAAPSNNATPTKAGCSVAMNGVNFAKMKQAVADKPFSDTKMSTAKVATKNACLSVDQVKEICKLFSMDDEKLAYAKYAYDYCVDKANYYQVSDVFSFSGTTEEFNKFLEQ